MPPVADQPIQAVPVKDDYLVDTLADMGLVTNEDVVQARAEVDSGEFTDQGVIDRLLATQIISPAHITQAKAIQFGMETVDLTGLTLKDDALQALPRHIANKYKCVPVYFEEGHLIVAITDPSDLDTMDSLRHVLKVENLEFRVATDEQVQQVITKYYATAEESVAGMIQDMTEGEIDLGFATQTDMDADQEAEDADAPLIKLVNTVIADAYKMRGSDIHIEPLEKRLRIRYRIDGCLQEVQSPPKKLQNAIISRLKIQAGMSIAEKRIPQDGRIQLRILDKSGLKLGLTELGFLTDDQQTFERLIGLPDGILLVTGPTGSGKTTTLYSCLNYINRPDRKIITVEDPVEYVLAGINQVQVHEVIGLTFAAALRAMLRQAPNVVMLGEIRDMETATIAINASLTGHLVFSTLHTNDAPGAVQRLVDIGIKPFLVASASRAFMAQRLVRRICKKCIGPGLPSEVELKTLNLDPNLPGAKYSKGMGCDNCNKSGYRGRFGVFEVFVVDDSARKLIFEKVSSTTLRARAREMGMRSLREDGARKVVAGMTTAEEVIKATTADDKAAGH
jgi:type IV pilus assembly protein PilB